MQTVVEDEELKDAVAVGPTQTEEVHGDEVHTHQKLDAGSLLGHEEVAMDGCRGAEDGSAQVEEVALAIDLYIGIEAQKTAEVHEENEVEVGKVVLAAIKPFNAAAHIVEKGLVLLLVTQGIM